MKTLNTSEENGARKVIKDIEIVGNTDLFELICKASSKAEGWMKSTKAMQLSRGVVLQVTTQQGDNVAEALTYLPGATIMVNGEGDKYIE
jgi:hypothetical protein